MGAKTALLVYTEQHPAELLRQTPALDREAARALVAATHPGRTGTATSTESLPDCVYPPDGVVYAGCFPGIDVLCDQQVTVDRPSSEAGRSSSRARAATHKRTRYRFRPAGSLIPVEE